jgi:hypothetical protein
MTMKKPLYLFIFIICLSFLSGCFSAGKNRTGELSDAMEVASDDYDGEREVETGFSPSSNVDSIDAAKMLVQKIDNNESNKKSSEKLTKEYSYSSLFFRLGSGVVSSNDYYGLNNCNVNLRFRDSKQGYSQFYLGYAFAPLQKTSKLSKSIKSGIKIFELGLEHVQFTTPPYTFLGHYVLIGFEYDILYWKYKNPFYADVYDDYGNVIYQDLIKDDILSGIDIHIGSGFNLVQTWDFQVGAELVPGLKLWWFESYEGFSNDIFRPFFYAKIRFTVNFTLNRNR